MVYTLKKWFPISIIYNLLNVSCVILGNMSRLLSKERTIVFQNLPLILFNSILKIQTESTQISEPHSNSGPRKDDPNRSSSLKAPNSKGPLNLFTREIERSKMPKEQASNEKELSMKETRGRELYQSERVLKLKLPGLSNSTFEGPWENYTTKASYCSWRAQGLINPTLESYTSNVRFKSYTWQLDPNIPPRFAVLTPISEGNNEGLLETIMEQTVKKVNEEINSANEKTTVASNQCYDIPKGNTSLPIGATFGPSYVEHNVKPVNSDGPSCSTSPTFAKVKGEPWDYSENHNVNKDVGGSISIELPNVKSEWEVHNEYHDDQAEHMNLIDRLNFLMAGADSSLNISTSYSSLRKIKPSSFISSSIFSKSTESSSINHRRKRKKTATDSVQEALEEDAPGLLQVLLDKGVLVDEIKLYGDAEDDEGLDESFSEDSFSELEGVMTKIFSQRHSLKSPITRASRASRASYCLACLISLVEQTRYLKFRKWPVEWGWCRDLQSFIFVFQRHNRIVLERPEYGYATYFFELLDSLPVEWQIKRLVIAMKLTTCSRISIIENKELLVGEDLSEGEAKVLMEYGWTPNTGMGTMLNYCDRVLHDRKNEDNTSEWRSKIGKLLMDGYNSGTILTTNVPKKVAEYMCADESPDISSSTPMSD
ncbi:hypothetical protein CR513_33589, partial [Mucuna pruriens]